MLSKCVRHPFVSEICGHLEADMIVHLVFDAIWLKLLMWFINHNHLPQLAHQMTPVESIQELFFKLLSVDISWNQLVFLLPFFISLEVRSWCGEGPHHNPRSMFSLQGFFFLIFRGIVLTKDIWRIILLLNSWFFIRSHRNWGCLLTWLRGRRGHRIYLISIQ